MALSPEQKPLALTMGEPAGIGPEMTVKLWRDRRGYSSPLPPFVYFGSGEVLRAYDATLPFRVVTNASQALECFDQAIPVMDIALSEKVSPGKIQAGTAAAVVKSIAQAVQRTLDGEFAAVVTNPINKAALYNEGFSHPGHTEFLAECCNVPIKNAVMMLACEGLRVVPVTVHIALADVASTLTMDSIVHRGVLAATDLRNRFGIKSPRLAIAALNPHAGEGGTMGLEEALHIKPAVDALCDMGIDATGPHAADTLFHSEARKKYDAALCMYHDQALIPLKTLDFHSGVNITLGLPIIRTSPDHGTALDIAGRGTAQPDSLLNALYVANELSQASL